MAVQKIALKPNFIDHDIKHTKFQDTSLNKILEQIITLCQYKIHNYHVKKVQIQKLKLEH